MQKFELLIVTTFLKRAILVMKSECFPDNKGISQAAKQAQCFSSGPVWAQLLAQWLPAAQGTAVSGQRERAFPSLNQSIFTIAAALPSATERISRCVWPLRIPGMPVALSYYLWTCTKSHTNSVRICVSMTEMLWRDCCHQFLLDTSFIQAKVKSRVTDAWYCIMMTTTTSLSMETEVQKKKKKSRHILRYVFNFH